MFVPELNLKYDVCNHCIVEDDEIKLVLPVAFEEASNKIGHKIIQIMLYLDEKQGIIVEVENPFADTELGEDLLCFQVQFNAEEINYIVRLSQLL